MNKCKITGKVLVIHLGREEVRIVRMNGSEVQHRAAFVTPKGAVEDGVIRNPEAIREILKAAMKTRELRGVRQAVFVLSTSQVITAAAHTPVLSESRLEKLLMANMDMYFPVDIQDYHVIWQLAGIRVSENGIKEQAVQLWAVPNDVTQRYYSVANTCGLSVVAIDYCGHSIATAIGAGFGENAKKTAKKKSGLNREISFGKKKTQEADSAVAVEEREIPDTDLHISLDKDLLGMTFVQEGRVVLQRFVRGSSDPIYQFSELAMILDYFSAQESGRGSQVRGTISGDYAADAEICRELSDMLGIPLEVISGSIAPQMVLFAGAVRTNIDFGTPALNRPGKVRREFQSQLWQYALILLCGAVLVGVILLSLSSQLVWNASIRALDTELQTVTIQAQKSAGFADNYKKYAANYDSYSADWDTVYSSLQTYNDNLALMLQELEDILPENTSVTALQIASNGMNVSFACETKEEAAFLIMALRQLKYADLYAISNLGGGGGGAADSYGPEEAPTKGSYDPDAGSGLTVTFNLSADARATGGTSLNEMIASELTEEEMMDLVTGLTTEQLTLLEKTYGKTPDTTYQTLAQLKEKAFPTPTFVDRKAALIKMFNSDPFAGNRFMNLLMEDFYRSESILMKYILWDILELQQSGQLSLDTSDPAAVRESMDALLEILTKDDTNLTATEALICSEAKASGKEASVSELTYVHYLEVQLRLRPVERFPFLDMDKMVGDLLNGGFNTGDKTLDAKLNGLISDETWALLRSFESQEKIGEMFADYVNKGTTGQSVVDELITAYLREGTTGSKKLDQEFEAYLDSKAMASLTTQMLTAYLTKGTTGNDLMDDLTAGYFYSGTTGNSHIDAQYKACLAGSDIRKVMVQSLEAYLTNGVTGNNQMDAAYSNYLATGTTGSTVLDTLITDTFAGGSLDACLEALCNRYIDDNTTGNAALDTAIGKYVSSGTCDNLYLDRIFSKLIPSSQDPFDGRTQEEIAELFGQYLTLGTTGDNNLDKRLNAYFAQGTSGNDVVDKTMDTYLSGSDAKRAITGWVDSYLLYGTTGNKIFDALVGGTFAENTSGNATIDGIIRDHIEGGSADAQLEVLVKKYVDSGSSGIATLDKKLSRFYSEGTTGSVKLDGMLRKHSPQPEEDPFNGMSNSQIKDMLDQYFATGTTGNGAMDVMLDKYMSTGSTGNPALDTIIKSYTAASESDDYISGLLEKYFANGTTGRAALDKMIDDYILEGTTGNPVMDIAIAGTLGSSAIVSNSVIQMLDNYLAVGTTGNKAMDKAIENYFLKGTTGNKNLDKVIEDYMNERSEALEDKFNQLFVDYLANGTTGYIVFDKMIDQYLQDDTTGNRFMDVVMEEYMHQQFGDLFNKYLNEGTSGIPAFDKMLENYLMKGTTGNVGYDRMIDQYIRSDAVKKMLVDLAKKYNENGTTGNSKLDALFFLYLIRGTTGNPELDALIKELNLFPGKDPSKPGTSNPSKPGGSLDDFWNNLLGGGTQTGPVDTRITLTVTLLYSQELKDAELIRKGLDYDGKIDKLEVDG